MNVYIKSVAYLVAFGGAGYVLAEITKPSQEKIDLLKRQHHPEQTAEDTSKKALFMKKLKEASESSEPIYLKRKAD